MAAMFGFVTCTVSINSASRTGRLSLSEVRSMEIRWKVGSFGLALRREVAAAADAAPIKAELQLHFTFWPMEPIDNYSVFEKELFNSFSLPMNLSHNSQGRAKDINFENTEVTFDISCCCVYCMGIFVTSGIFYFLSLVESI